MGKDIFAEYIKGLKPMSRTADASKMSQETYVEPRRSQSDETLNVLREISRKLDNIGQNPVNQSPVNWQPGAVLVGEEADLAIVNGTVVLPDCGLLRADLYVRDGKICGIGSGEKVRTRRTIDASGRYVCPGIIDPHVHLGLFAPMETDMVSETRAAILGGITTTGVFLGGEKSHFQTFPEIEEQASRFSYTDIVPHLVIGSEEQRREIRDYAEHLGVTSFKVYMNGIPGMIPSVNDGFIMDVFDEMRKTGKNCILCCHAENHDLVARALRDAKAAHGDCGRIEDWEKTHPAMAEEEAVMRIAYLAEQAQMPVYLVHIGTKEGIGRLRKIKPYNRFVHVETTSPYLSVCGNQRKDALYKMEPPLRECTDTEALWRGVEEGLIDTIGTDNVCETKEEKRPELPIWDVVPGYSVVETHLASVLTEGVMNRGLSIEKVITHMTKRPAETFGIYPQKGSLLPGSDADIVIVDLGMDKEVHASNLLSRSDFSIYEGRRLRGWPVMTIKGGQIVMEDGRMTGQPPSGQMLKR